MPSTNDAPGQARGGGHARVERLGSRSPSASAISAPARLPLSTVET